MSDNTPQNPGETPGGYAPPPQQPGYSAPQQPGYSAPQQPGYSGPQPPAYAPPPAYGSPQYPAQAPYGAATGYPYAPQQKTNTLAVVSLVASLVGIVWILPFIGSLVGVITGHMALNQLKTSGEKGRGLALAGTIVGWVGLAITIVLGIIIILAFVYAAQSSGEFTT